MYLQLKQYLRYDQVLLGNKGAMIMGMHTVLAQCIQCGSLKCSKLQKTKLACQSSTVHMHGETMQQLLGQFTKLQSYVQIIIQISAALLVIVKVA